MARLKKVEKLEPRKRKYVQGRVAGKSKFRAAIDAGFSPNTAISAGVKIESKPDVQAAFRELMRASIPERVLVLKMAEGLDAQKSTMSGDMVPDYKVRHDYLKTAAEWADYVPKEQMAITVPVQVNIDL